MTVVHIGALFPLYITTHIYDCTTHHSPVLFKFLPSVSAEHKNTFVTQLKTLKSLPCVLNERLLVGGPSITDPIERSKGYEFSLVSFHRDREALEEYQTSDEHHR